MTDDADTVRAAVYIDSERARKLAEEALDPLGPDEGGSFNGVLEGRLALADVERLNEGGLVVELVDHDLDKPAVSQAQLGPAQTIAENAELIDEIKQQSSTVSFSEDESSLVIGDESADHDPRLHHFDGYEATPTQEKALSRDAYNIEINGPITREQRLELDRLGVDLAAFEPGFGYRTFLTREQYGAVRQLPYVSEVRRYSFTQAVTPELLDTAEEGATDEEAGLMSEGEEGEPEPQVFDCIVHREGDLEKVCKLIEKSPGTAVIDTSNLRVRFSVDDVDLRLVSALAQLPEVRQTSPFEAPTL